MLGVLLPAMRLRTQAVKLQYNAGERIADAAGGAPSTAWFGQLAAGAMAGGGPWVAFSATAACALLFKRGCMQPPPPPWSGPSHALGGFFLLIPHPFTAPPALCQAGGGGCFPVHYDSDERLDARRLTAILYLNPGWSVPQHGGAVRLYPWPAAPVDVAPLAGRLLLFSSTRMAHRRAH
jgi:hypothetical protein